MGLQEPGPPVYLDHHSREFRLQLSRQVANSSARIRVEEATPALCGNLVTVALGCEFFLVLRSAVSLQALRHTHTYLATNSSSLFYLER